MYVVTKLRNQMMEAMAFRFRNTVSKRNARNANKRYVTPVQLMSARSARNLNAMNALRRSVIIARNRNVIHAKRISATNAMKRLARLAKLAPNNRNPASTSSLIAITPIKAGSVCRVSGGQHVEWLPLNPVLETQSLRADRISLVRYYSLVNL